MVEEIKVNKEEVVHHIDGGGGYRRVTAQIFIDPNLPPRRQKEVVIYETLAAMLTPPFTHEIIEELTDNLVDALDQID